MTLGEPKDVHAPAQRSGADFWPMTIIVTVILIAVLVVLGRLILIGVI